MLHCWNILVTELNITILALCKGKTGTERLKLLPEVLLCVSGKMPSLY